MNWIPIAECLPEPDVDVLCAHHVLFADIACVEQGYMDVERRFYIPTTTVTRIYPTHWMPLTNEPPREEG